MLLLILRDSLPVRTFVSTGSNPTRRKHRIGVTLTVTSVYQIIVERVPLGSVRTVTEHVDLRVVCRDTKPARMGEFYPASSSTSVWPVRKHGIKLTWNPRTTYAGIILARIAESTLNQNTCVTPRVAFPPKIPKENTYLLISKHLKRTNYTSVTWVTNLVLAVTVNSVWIPKKRVRNVGSVNTVSNVNAVNTNTLSCLPSVSLRVSYARKTTCTQTANASPAVVAVVSVQRSIRRPNSTNILFVQILVDREKKFSNLYMI